MRGRWRGMRGRRPRTRGKPRGGVSARDCRPDALGAVLARSTRCGCGVRYSQTVRAPAACLAVEAGAEEPCTGAARVLPLHGSGAGRGKVSRSAAHLLSGGKCGGIARAHGAACLFELLKNAGLTPRGRCGRLAAVPRRRGRTVGGKRPATNETSCNPSTGPALESRLLPGRRVAFWETPEHEHTHEHTRRRARVSAFPSRTPPRRPRLPRRRPADCLR